MDTMSIPAPTPAQLAWQQAGLGVFFHFGVNTFTGKEWSDGTLPPALFNPTDLDTDEWVLTAKELGAAYVVLTAKHHDGFCLWPTATTDYSVASSPWRYGRGDLVREVADSARRHGLGLGLYLSPWDRHEPSYGNPSAYDEFYLRQLRELCTGYGELVEVWFDGAGSAGREYDWERISELLAELQPNAMVFNMGPATIRWVGNEDGLASDPCEYAVHSSRLNNYDDDQVEYGQAQYLPPECDVSLRRGWFWQPDEKPKSLAHLLAIHDRSIGLGANLLLNIPPDRRGRIDVADRDRVREFREALNARFGTPVTGILATSVAEDSMRVVLPAGTRFDHLELQEDLSSGQRVTAHRVFAADGTILAEGRTIGVRRIHRLDTVSTSDDLVVELSGEDPGLRSVQIYHAAGAPQPALPADYRASTETPPD